MFKCFSIRERDGGFIKARIPTSSKETLVENRCPFFAYLQLLWERRGGGSTAWMAEAGLSWREIRCVEKGGFSGQWWERRLAEDELRKAETEGQAGVEKGWRRIVEDRGRRTKRVSLCESVGVCGCVYLCVLKSVHAYVADRERRW